MSAEALHDAFRTAITRMCTAIDESGRQTTLLAIGYITTDDLAGVAAFLLFDGDLPADAERYRTLFPVEWIRSDGDSFAAVNDIVKSGRLRGESDEDYHERVRGIFEACADITEAFRLRERYPNLGLITFASVDPSPFFVEQEGLFVRRLNSNELWRAWQEEQFGQDE